MKNIDGFGTMKIFSYSKNVNRHNNLIADKTLRVCIFFNWQFEKITLGFPNSELKLLSIIGGESSIFKNPRMKRISNNEIVLSGLLLQDEKIYLSIAKFEAKVPETFTFFTDDFVYPEDFWK